MKRAPAARKAGEVPTRAKSGLDVDAASRVVLTSLEDDKAEEILAIDIRGKSSFADMLIVASGRSARHVSALADHVLRKLKEAGAGEVRVEGLPQGDWVLVDAGDVIVHLFRPEVRSFYNIERIWSAGPGPNPTLPS
jgi:ribosome-associated protein